MSKRIKLLYHYGSGANCQYFETMLKLLEGRSDFSYKIIRPNQIENTYFQEYDVLVYQTFPDNKNLRKHNPAAIKVLDKIFTKFKGFKILLDSFDMGDNNGYERFGIAWPRIKHVPSYEYLKRFDVISIICTTGWIQEDLIVPLPELTRPIIIHSAFTVGVYPHEKRERVVEILQRRYSSAQTSFERIPVEEYNNFLRKVQISVVVGGFGETSGSAYPTLRAGALLFVHEDIQKVKLLPFADLVDGEDYVSFNRNNFTEKLEWIFFEEDERNKIRLSGQRKFAEGFDHRRSAKEFLNYLKAKVA